MLASHHITPTHPSDELVQNVKSPLPSELQAAEAKISPPIPSGVSPVPATTPVLAADSNPVKEPVYPEHLTADDELVPYIMSRLNLTRLGWMQSLVNYFVMNMVKMCTTMLEDRTNRVVDAAKEPSVRCAPVFGHLPPEILVRDVEIRCEITDTVR